MNNWLDHIKPKNLKYAKWYEQLINNAKARTYKLDYQEVHHIIPRSLGGSDEKHNLVGLSLREHFIAHLLLWRMGFPGQYNEKMAYAFSFMSRLQGKANINNRLYETARIQCSRKGKTFEELYTPEQIERMHKARENRVIPPKSLERMKQGQLNASKCPMPGYVKIQVGNRFRGRTDLNGENNGMFGRKHSKESKAKMRAALVGRKQTAEQMEKRRQTYKENAKTCVHCGKTCARHNYSRWHGDNCKLKGKNSMSKVYKHSGTFGDLIYSLFAVERMGGGTIAIALNNIEKCVSEYAYKPEEVDEAHRGRFTQTDYDLLEPLLKAQPYINDVVVWDGTHDVDLDKFRGVLFRGFEGNYVQAMCITHKLDFVMSDYDHTWLIAASNKVAPVVVNRTMRYRDLQRGDAMWQKMYHDGKMGENAIFLGTQGEHEDFVNTVGPIQHYKVKDMLEMAAVIEGADLFVGNQSVAYSLAMGLGKTSVLETMKIKPLQNNECYFPRNNITYF